MAGNFLGQIKPSPSFSPDVLYPFNQVTPYYEDQSNFNAAYAALLARGDDTDADNPAWNTAWKMSCFARSLKGDMAMRTLAYALNANGHEPRFSNNLLSRCGGVFQIDGNGGTPAAMAEMLLQSYSGVIDILPALPRMSWPSGSIRGLKAVGNYEVDIKWKDGMLENCTITDCITDNSRDGIKIRLHKNAMPSELYQLRINGVKLFAEDQYYADRHKSVTREGENGASYTYDPLTETYTLHLPAIVSFPLVCSFNDDYNPSTGINVITEGEDREHCDDYEYYDTLGRRLSGIPEHGIFIRKSGNQSVKICR